MREIKFKVFDYGSNKMYSSCYESIKGIEFGMYGEVSEVIILKYSPKGYWEFETLTEIEILPFTGLKDINNKEIFEGDILEGNIDVDEAGVVEWNDEIAGYCVYISWGGINIKDYLEGHSVEIIGNKFENKELLKD
jgi:uncharacterized phage protein (TIGR01671 family)